MPESGGHRGVAMDEGVHLGCEENVAVVISEKLNALNLRDKGLEEYMSLP